MLNVQYLAIYYNENLPKRIKNCQIVFRILAQTK